ncbi:MAG: hypothetical protein U0796_19940 [Gemmatales bacterium]
MESRLLELKKHVDLVKLIGYLNFSNGRSDSRFQKAWNIAQARVSGINDTAPWKTLCDWLYQHADSIVAEAGAAFQDLTQAKLVLQLLPQKLIPEYRQFHRDLLQHVPDQELFPPLMVVRMLECLLSETGLKEEPDLAIAHTIKKLNDFIGYRPVATLENGRLGDTYPQESLHPIPLYLADVGVGYGRYEQLIQQSITVLNNIPEELLEEASFDLKRLAEWSYDARCYDHSHPANRRPNYVFGEWDPQQLDGSGNYRRYITRSITLEILQERYQNVEDKLREEYLQEAGIVLAGTVLMASAMSGRGPGSYDSSVKLSTLVPRIAKLRDNFYAYSFSRLQGKHKKRLEDEADRMRQPFAGARQSLNQAITRHRAEQLQTRHLSYFLADINATSAARERLRPTSPVSDRFQMEITNLLSELADAIDEGDLKLGLNKLQSIEDWLQRGIACGALPDPWNALGFQAQFPIFQSMEDAVLDHRLIELCEMMESTFQLAGRMLCMAAASGKEDDAKAARRQFGRMVQWWDRYATYEVSDLPRVAGEEMFQSALQVVEALVDWHAKGQTAGDLSFWRQHLKSFTSASSFSLVLDVLLMRRDYAAAMALLINWLSHASEVPLEDGKNSFYDLMTHWMVEVLQARQLQRTEQWKYLKRFFDLLEANAEEYWDLSQIEVQGVRPDTAKEDNPFAAAYEGMAYRDSTDDGNDASLADDDPVSKVGADFPLEHQADSISQRISFLAHVAHLWQLFARQSGQFKGQDGLRDSLTGWWKLAVQQREQLLPLLERIYQCVVPEPLGNQASMMEYDRQRHVKDRLMELGISAALDIAQAEASLLASSYAIANEDVPATVHGDWERHAVQLENLIWRGSVGKIGGRLDAYLEALSNVSLLYKPLDAGGSIEENYRTRLAQTTLRDLVTALPRLGQVKETYQVLKAVRDSERAQSIQGRVVTEFNRLFEFAMHGLTASVSRSSTHWQPEVEPSRLIEILDHLAKPFLMLWIDHSHSVRLSSLEGIQEDDEWKELREFIRKFGSDLFHPKFMTLSNLRAILSRGIPAFISYMEEEASLVRDDEPMAGAKLMHAIERRKISREVAARHLEMVLKTVVENYEEYKDYNATTTQSDYGENIYRLISFLRLKTTYERHVWNIRPLIWIHESLVREGHTKAAELWKENIKRMTGEIARRHVEHLREIQAEHGMQLRTVADLIEERFLAPLEVDCLVALVAPAVREIEEKPRKQERGPALRSLLAKMDELAKTTSGSGLDVPAWIRKLEQEGEFVAEQQEMEKLLDPPFFIISLNALEEQLSQWETGLQDTGLLPE